MLAEEQHAAANAAGGGEPGFAATGRAYVRFAIAHPGVFRLIFSSAFQPLRGTIAGEPAFWSVRAGTPAGGLQTKYARSRVTLGMARSTTWPWTRA